MPIRTGFGAVVDVSRFRSLEVVRETLLPAANLVPSRGGFWRQEMARRRLFLAADLTLSRGSFRALEIPRRRSLFVGPRFCGRLDGIENRHFLDSTEMR